MWETEDTFITQNTTKALFVTTSRLILYSTVVYYSIFINQSSSATSLDMDDFKDDYENISGLYPLLTYHDFPPKKKACERCRNDCGTTTVSDED